MELKALVCHDSSHTWYLALLVSAWKAVCLNQSWGARLPSEAKKQCLSLIASQMAHAALKNLYLKRGADPDFVCAHISAWCRPQRESFAHPHLSCTSFSHWGVPPHHWDVVWSRLHEMPQSRGMPNVPQLLVEHQVQISAWSFRPLHTRWDEMTPNPVKSDPWFSKTGDGGLSPTAVLTYCFDLSNCKDLIINIERIYACPNSGIGKDWSLPFPLSLTLNDS